MRREQRARHFPDARHDFLRDDESSSGEPPAPSPISHSSQTELGTIHAMTTALAIVIAILVLLVLALAWAVRRLLLITAGSEAEKQTLSQRLRDTMSEKEPLRLEVERLNFEKDRLELELSNALRGPARAPGDDVPYHRIVAGLAELADRVTEPRDDDSYESITIANPFSVLEHDDWRRSVELWRQNGMPLIDSLAPRNCPACDSTDHRLLFQSYDGYPFHECDECRTWFVPKQVNSSLFARFFEQNPESHALSEKIVEQRTESERECADRDRFTQYLEFLSPLVDASGSDRRYLDIGCGLGHSLGAARDLGYDARGIEVDEQSVRIAQANGHQVDLPGTETVSGEFGLVALWETIEHLDRAREIVREAVKSLRPSGILALTFPNLDNLGARVLRSDCIWIHGGIVTPGHINLFNAATIARMLDDLGLEVIDVSSQYGTNLDEVILYTQGRHRGVEDHLRGETPHLEMRRSTHTLLSSIAPTWNLIEKANNLAPILQVVACRKGERGPLESVLAQLQSDRRDEIRHDLQSRVPVGI